MILANNVYAVILAGGSGTRFWPKSRHLTPKQLCAIGSADHTMLEATLNRLDGFIPPERRMIVTHKNQLAETKRTAGEKCKLFLAEPEARNTANALALAAIELKSRAGDNAIMVSLHADAVMQNEAVFRKAVSEAVTVAQENFLTLLGVTARYPETGYGYIEKGASLPLKDVAAYQVQSFREKPNHETAKKYVASGNFFWNAGIFVWKVSTIIAELSRFLPNAVAELSALLPGKDQSFAGVPLEKLAATYSQLPKIAIDNAVLEVSKAVALVEADIGWQDVGSWDALSQCFPTDDKGNLVYGDVLAFDCENTTIDSDGNLVACLGLKDMVVVSAKGAVLVCPKNRAQEVKKFVEHLEKTGRREFL